MRFIYGVGRPRGLEFGVASRRVAVPEGAELYAICEGAHTVRHLDEQTFAAMTDEEYFTLRELIAEAERAETTCAANSPSHDARPLGRLVRWVRGMLGAAPKNACACSAAAGSPCLLSRP